MFRAYVEYINEECGGIRGRQVALELIEVPLFGPTTETERNEACLKATEDLNAVMILNSSGFKRSDGVHRRGEGDDLYFDPGSAPGLHGSR